MPAVAVTFTPTSNPALAFVDNGAKWDGSIAYRFLKPANTSDVKAFSAAYDHNIYHSSLSDISAYGPKLLVGIDTIIGYAPVNIYEEQSGGVNYIISDLDKPGYPEFGGASRGPGAGGVLLGYELGHITGNAAISDWAIIHELGHVLGLKGDNATDPASLQSLKYTMMSYENSDGYPVTPMALDVAIIQRNYGTSNHNEGNTVYNITAAGVDLGGGDGSIANGGRWVCIWDTGGVDRINYDDDKNVVINLNSATLNITNPTGSLADLLSELSSSEKFKSLPRSAREEILDPGHHAGGFLSSTFDGDREKFGYTIANGVTIENASGGSGSDLIIGNQFDNVLEGRGGRDQLNGGAGRDTLDGGSGDDSLYGGSGDDQILASSGKDTIDGGGGRDVLASGDVQQTLLGGAEGDGLFVYHKNVVIDQGIGDDFIKFRIPNQTNIEDIKIPFKRGGGHDYVDAPVQGTFVVDATGFARSEAHLTVGPHRTISVIPRWSVSQVEGQGEVSEYTKTTLTDYDDVFIKVGQDSIRIGKLTVKNVEGTINGVQFPPTEEYKFDVFVRVDFAQGSYFLQDFGNVHHDFSADMLAGKGDYLNVVGGGGSDSLPGTPGNDSLVGTSGHDTVAGGQGDDRLEGGDGDDLLIGGAGADTIVGGSGVDTASYEGASSEYIIAKTSEGFDVTHIASGEVDRLSGVERAKFSDQTVELVEGQLFLGTAGADTIAGGAAGDSLRGSGGNDSLAGAGGSDAYFYALGDGADTISDSGGSILDNDRLVLEGIAPADVTLSRSGQDLVVHVGSESLRIVDQFAGAVGGVGIEAITFAGGQVWDRNELTLRSAANAGNLNGTAGDDTLSGTSGDDVFLGAAGDDQILSDAGSDTFLYRSGDGNDKITEMGASSSEVDTLRLVDLTASGVRVLRSGNDLLVKIGATGQQVRVVDQFMNNPGGKGIERIEFSDGAAWSRAELQARAQLGDVIQGTANIESLSGTENADTLSGAAGNDTLAGGLGPDTYVYSSGDGSDVIIEPHAPRGLPDTLLLADLNPSQFTFAKVGYDLVLQSLVDASTISVSGHFHPVYDNGIERLQFANGAVWGRSEILAATSTGNSSIGGTSGQDTLIATAGSDTLAGGDAPDIFVFSVLGGNDFISEPANAFSRGTGDRLVFQGDVTPAKIHVTRSAIDADDMVLRVDGYSGSITVDEQFYWPGHFNWGYGIEEIQFANGVVWDMADIRAAYIREYRTSGADVINGFPQADFYSFGPSDGSDVIVDGPYYGVSDELFFAPEFTRAKVSVTRDLSKIDDLIIKFEGFDNSIRIVDGYYSDRGVEKFHFIDGTQWAKADFIPVYLNKAFTDQSDTVAGFKGETTFNLNSVVGDDVIIEGNDFGAGTEIDKIVLSSGVNITGLQVFRSGADQNDAKIQFSTGSITIKGQFLSLANGSGVERIEFADGNVWGKYNLQQFLISSLMTSGNDSIQGFAGGTEYKFANLIGNDAIYEGSYYGSADDIIIFGSGLNSTNFTIERQVGDVDDVKLIFGPNSSLLLDEQFVPGGWGVEKIQFGDGVIWTNADLQSAYIAQVQTSGNDIIVGFSGATTFNISNLSGADVLQEGDYYGSAANGDKVVFGAGMTTANLQIIRGTSDPNDVTFSFGAGKTLTIDDEFAASGQGPGVEEFVFGDGLQWTKTDLRAWYLSHAQTSGDDTVLGFSNVDDVLSGGAGKDRLDGLSGADTLDGGAGADTLAGGSGNDIFRVSSLADSGLGSTARDVIADFSSGSDKVDLSAIDGNANVAGDQAFVWIGTAAFSSTAGELRIADNSSGVRVIAGDVDGDGAADFELQFTGNISLSAASFIM